MSFRLTNITVHEAHLGVWEVRATEANVRVVNLNHHNFYTCSAHKSGGAQRLVEVDSRGLEYPVQSLCWCVKAVVGAKNITRCTTPECGAPAGFATMGAVGVVAVCAEHYRKVGV